MGNPDPSINLSGTVIAPSKSLANNERTFLPGTKVLGLTSFSRRELARMPARVGFDEAVAWQALIVHVGLRACS